MENFLVYNGFRKWRIAYRPRAKWTVMSLYSDAIWKPKNPQIAWCKKTKSFELCPTRIGHHHCGVWACRTPKDLERQINPKYYIEGKVELSDNIIEESWGARAKIGIIKEFWLLPQFEYCKELVDYLETFEVPIVYLS